jgi:putative membrane protein
VKDDAMETEISLDHSMDKAKKHYSSLFFLPSYKRALASIAAICIIGVTLTAYVFSQNISILALGITLFLVTIIADLLMCRIILRDGPIFIMRRTSAMSFYCWLLWLGFAALGTVLGFFFGWLLWVKLVLLGFAAVVTLRTIVITATSNSAKWRQILSALLQPILCIAVFFVFWAIIAGNLTLQFLPFIVLSPIISYTAVYLLLHSIDRLGKNTYSLPAMPLFRAFLLNWVTDLNAPLEAHLEEMGKNADIEVSIIKFEGSKPKAAIIVPLVHPGPFKNIGSSLLPSLLKHCFEKEYGCDACTPLGILGHELDLASQAQNQKIVEEVLSSAKFKASNALASSFTRVSDGTAIASCQIFGDTVFLSFSLAPKTTEDLPQELGRMVADEAKKYGLTHAVVVNAHNCLTDVDDTKEHLDELKRAAAKCLQSATAQPKKPFMVGSASVFPEDFTQKQGMGTGGITAVVVEVDGQKTAYVVIDGNNMVPNLREKILESLTALGFSSSEVFTTDTHAVSALVTGSRGYHPVGEVMNQDALINYISDVAKKAALNLEVAKAGCVQFIVPQVRVIGEERLNAISNLVDKAIEKAKKVVAPIFGTEGLLLIMLLLLF